MTHATDNSVLTVDATATDLAEVYKLLMSAFIPRAVSWVSTISKDGVANVAPYGWSGAISGEPPIMHFTSRKKRDSWRNATETGSFVINMPTTAQLEQLKITGEDVGPEVSEFELAGLTPVPGEVVDAPLVAESPVSIECVTHSTHEIGGSTMVFGTVARIHISRDILDAAGRIDPVKMSPLSKLGGPYWAGIELL